MGMANGTTLFLRRHDLNNKMKIDKILNLIGKRLENVNYAFIGSANLYIQGAGVQPRDIDILTTPKGIKEIDKIFSKSRTKEIYFDESDGRNSFRSLYMIDGKEIEVLGNVGNVYRKSEILDKRIYIKFNKIKLPCIPLTDELNTYKQMGRAEKVEMIQEFLQLQK